MRVAAGWFLALALGCSGGTAPGAGSGGSGGSAVDAPTAGATGMNTATAVDQAQGDGPGDAGAGPDGSSGGAPDLAGDVRPDARGDLAADAPAPDAPSTVDVSPDGPLPLGRRCTTPEQCQSKFCVEGYCCNEACPEICRGCALYGREGTCTRRPEGVTCGSSSCAGDVQQLAPSCRAGVCTPGATKSCAPASCLNGQCTGVDCTTHGDCLPGWYCSAGRCAQKHELSWSCKVKEECQSGFCVDGRCCNNACQQLCHYCSIAGTEGTCTALQNNQDPRRDCPPDPSNPCGRGGSCDGRGGCIMRNSETVCGASSCTGSTWVADLCDGAGTCRPGVVIDCAPFVCKGNRCPVYCTSTADCMAGYTCQNLTCVK